jgi:hypothetical protein
MKEESADNVVAAEDPDHLEARLRLANVLEDQGKKAEALEIVTDGTYFFVILPVPTSSSPTKSPARSIITCTTTQSCPKR